MLQFDNLKLVKNRNASADESPLSYSLQQGALRLMSFSDPEGHKGLPYCPSGRQRNKHLLSVIIFKGLAAADLLDLGEKELRGGEKAEFLWFPRWFSMLTPYPSLPCAGRSLWQPGHAVLPQPSESITAGTWVCKPTVAGRPTFLDNHRALPHSLQATASSLSPNHKPELSSPLHCGWQ